jgi:hypothetical protein
MLGNWIINRNVVKTAAARSFSSLDDGVLEGAHNDFTTLRLGLPFTMALRIAWSDAFPTVDGTGPHPQDPLSDVPRP